MAGHGRSEGKSGSDEVPEWLDEVLDLADLTVEGDDMQRAARAAVRDAYRGLRRADPLLTAAQLHGEGRPPFSLDVAPPRGSLIVRAYIAERLHRLVRHACLSRPRRRGCYHAIEALGELEKRDETAWAGLVRGFPPLSRRGRAAQAEAAKVHDEERRALAEHLAAGGSQETRPRFYPVSADEGPRGALAALEELEGAEWRWLREDEVSLHAQPETPDAKGAGAPEHFALAHLMRAVREKRPIPSRAECAKVAGVTRQAVAKWPLFIEAWRRAKETEKGSVRRGHRDVRTGELDAEA